ncbi:MAG: DNA-protecting protein DprA [Ignavibacteria bacterium]|nr:DNA-protecting protein DprA [Ignavibacteria bacterium]MBI3765490.1 DNA-protecting protein DprA [Ignavibacteriales bacterium]
MFSVFDLLVLSQIPGIGSNRLRALVSHFGNPSTAMQGSPREIASVEGFSRRLATVVVNFMKGSQVDDAKKHAEVQLSKVNKVNARVLTFWDKQYPDALKRIFDPPTYLFVRGEILDVDKYAIAVVGTRSPSEYGETMAERFSQEVSRLGITVVSGLARGIDTVAHSTSLKSYGRSIAVVGSGVDIIYPPENRNLADRLIEHGAMVSEYEMGAKPDAVNFPRRNRIISGLALGTLVIETDVNGGAMITATTALDQNREVFALPGNISSKRSKGCHALIKDGRAKLVETIEDILDELGPKLRPLLRNSTSEDRKPSVELTLFERKIYDVLAADSRHIDSIAEESCMSISDVLVNLLSLEFKGLVKQLAGKMFTKL